MSFDNCWYWAGQIKPNGYGALWFDSKKVYAHRFSYEVYKGEIPRGLEIDHLCNNRLCINPDHLEAVTHRENLLRGETLPTIALAKTHCSNGHPYMGSNLHYRKNGKRSCVTCNREYNRRHYYANKLALEF